VQRNRLRLPGDQIAHATYLVALTLLCGVACSGQDYDTKVFVVVWSDLAVPAELTASPSMSRADGRLFGHAATDQRNEAGKTKLPVVLALVPPNNQGLAFEVTASGYLGGTAMVSQDARLSFLSGQARVLTLFLGRACRA